MELQICQMASQKKVVESMFSFFNLSANVSKFKFLFICHNFLFGLDKIRKIISFGILKMVLF